MPPPGSDPDESKVSKDDARYTETPGQEDLPDAARCGGCAHFVPPGQTAPGIEGGLCKVVAGAVDADAVCHRFYADVGVFADTELTTDVRISSVLERGGVDDWTPTEVERFIGKLRARLAALTSAAEASKREQFAETVERADESVDELGLGPGALPDRTDRDSRDDQE